MKILNILALLLFAQTMLAYGQIPEPVTDLGDGDDIEALIKGYPQETHHVTTTLCGIKHTPEFRQGYIMALRLWLLGAEPHYLEYDEMGSLPDGYLPLRTHRLKNYKYSARLLESIRGFNDSMDTIARQQQVRAQTKKGESGSRQTASRPDLKSEDGDNPKPKTDASSR